MPAVALALALLAPACSSDPVPSGESFTPAGSTAVPVVTRPRPDGSAPSGSVPGASGVEDELGVARGQTADRGATTVAVSPSGRVGVEIRSSRASLITGGDALIRVLAPGEHGEAQLDLRLDDHDAGVRISEEMWMYGDVNGMLRGIRDHSTFVAAYGDDPADRVALELIDHPLGGPLISGPKPRSFVCTTQRTALGPSLDADCTVAPHFRWYYVGVDQAMHDLLDPKVIPAGVATTNVGGVDVPFIVREETGVLARSLYWITVLDPTPLVPGFGPLWRGDAWNRRLVYRYGGGCNTSYSQGTSFTNPNDLELLGKGYAIATGSLNTLQTLCNLVVSAEVTMVLKEHVIETYGVPELTIADGGSGGSMQQLFIAQNYPGLLDGLTPSLPYPDLVTSLPGITDCNLFEAYWQTAGGRTLTEAQRAAIEGFQSTTTCTNWIQALGGVLDPKDGCDPFLTPLVYDPRRNALGVRCTVADSNINIFGRDPITGIARRPIDNTGVQYGRRALEAGTISVDQFLDLNERIGGFDPDGRPIAIRSSMDDATAAMAYRSGYVSQRDGAGALADTPIILRNLYTDALGDIHDRFRVFSLRDRLRDEAGHDDPNLVIWTVENTNPDLLKALQGNDSVGNEPLFVMDEWLTEGARPAAAVDRCTVHGQRVAGERVYDEGVCRDAFPIHGDPRTAAGAPRRNDILKCARTPARGEGSWTDAQRARFERTFADGVCDWSRPGVGQAPLEQVWQVY